MAIDQLRSRTQEAEPVDHALLDDPTWSEPAVAPLKRMACEQFGTVGSGNHYVDVFEDEAGRSGLESTSALVAWDTRQRPTS
jgi:RNA-splicing ligase RtcB